MSNTELVPNEDSWFESHPYKDHFVRSMYRLSWHWEAISSWNSGCPPVPFRHQTSSTAILHLIKNWFPMKFQWPLQKDRFVRSMYGLSWHWEAISSWNSGCPPVPLQELDDPLYIWSIDILFACTCLLVYCSKLQQIPAYDWLQRVSVVKDWQESCVRYELVPHWRTLVWR